MSFHIFVPEKKIQIDALYSIHYFEYFKDFQFQGESHPFWEFLCVDQGEIDVVSGETTHFLKRGDIIFHEPDEFHNVKANGINSSNLVVISFETSSPAMDFFQKKILKIGSYERNLLGKIIYEAKNSFQTPLGDPYQNDLLLSDHAEFGSDQLILLYIEQLLLSLYRKYTAAVPVTEPSSLKKKNDTSIYYAVLEYLQNNIHRKLSIEDICRENLIGRSHLQRLFQENSNCSVIEKFSQLKIETAKRLIRESNLNFSQISESLGYTSIHYFSRQFKKMTNMTPSEYSSSIKSLSIPKES